MWWRWAVQTAGVTLHICNANYIQKTGGNVLHLQLPRHKFSSQIQCSEHVLCLHSPRYHFITKHLFKLEKQIQVCRNKRKNTKPRTEREILDDRDLGKTFGSVCVGGSVCFQDFYKLFCKHFLLQNSEN